MSKGRNQKGTIVEAAAVMCLMIPLILAVVYAVAEVSEAYRIKMGLAEAARQAARDLSVAYNKTPRVVGDKALQDSLVYEKIKVANVIAHPSQFDEAIFDTSSAPPTVRVVTHYISDEVTGLRRFPYVDPLNIGSGLEMNAEATYSLD